MIPQRPLRGSFILWVLCFIKSSSCNQPIPSLQCQPPSPILPWELRNQPYGNPFFGHQLRILENPDSYTPQANYLCEQMVMKKTGKPNVVVAQPLPNPYFIQDPNTLPQTTIHYHYFPPSMVLTTPPATTIHYHLTNGLEMAALNQGQPPQSAPLDAHPPQAVQGTQGEPSPPDDSPSPQPLSDQPQSNQIQPQHTFARPPLPKVPFFKPRTPKVRQLSAYLRSTHGSVASSHHHSHSPACFDCISNAQVTSKGRIPKFKVYFAKGSKWKTLLKSASKTPATPELGMPKSLCTLERINEFTGLTGGANEWRFKRDPLVNDTPLGRELTNNTNYKPGTKRKREHAPMMPPFVSHDRTKRFRPFTFAEPTPFLPKNSPFISLKDAEEKQRQGYSSPQESVRQVKRDIKVLYAFDANTQATNRVPRQNSASEGNIEGLAIAPQLNLRPYQEVVYFYDDKNNVCSNSSEIMREHISNLLSKSKDTDILSSVEKEVSLNKVVNSIGARILKNTLNSEKEDANKKPLFVSILLKDQAKSKPQKRWVKGPVFQFGRKTLSIKDNTAIVQSVPMARCLQKPSYSRRSFSLLPIDNSQNEFKPDLKKESLQNMKQLKLESVRDSTLDFIMKMNPNLYSRSQILSRLAMLGSPRNNKVAVCATDKPHFFDSLPKQTLNLQPSLVSEDAPFNPIKIEVPPFQCKEASMNKFVISERCNGADVLQLEDPKPARLLVVNPYLQQQVLKTSNQAGETMKLANYLSGKQEESKQLNFVTGFYEREGVGGGYPAIDAFLPHNDLISTEKNTQPPIVSYRPPNNFDAAANRIGGQTIPFVQPLNIEQFQKDVVAINSQSHLTKRNGTLESNNVGIQNTAVNFNSLQSSQPESSNQSSEVAQSINYNQEETVTTGNQPLTIQVDVEIPKEGETSKWESLSRDPVSMEAQFQVIDKQGGTDQTFLSELSSQPSTMTDSSTLSFEHISDENSSTQTEEAASMSLLSASSTTSKARLISITDILPKTLNNHGSLPMSTTTVGPSTTEKLGQPTAQVHPVHIDNTLLALLRQNLSVLSQLCQPTDPEKHEPSLNSKGSKRSSFLAQLNMTPKLAETVPMEEPGQTNSSGEKVMVIELNLADMMNKDLDILVDNENMEESPKWSLYRSHTDKSLAQVNHALNEESEFDKMATCYDLAPPSMSSQPTLLTSTEHVSQSAASNSVSSENPEVSSTPSDHPIEDVFTRRKKIHKQKGHQCHYHFKNHSLHSSSHKFRCLPADKRKAIKLYVLKRVDKSFNKS